jgi:hypothetical protein
MAGPHYPPSVSVAVGEFNNHGDILSMGCSKPSLAIIIARLTAIGGNFVTIRAIASAVLPYAASAIIGHYVTRSSLRLMRRKVDREYRCWGFLEKFKSVSWLTASAGLAERLIFTALVIYDVKYTPNLLAFWVALKFAGGWDQFRDRAPANRANFQIAILGNVLSIGTAVLIGIIYKYSAL